ncbi:hypothetical protein ABG885_07465, partial [Bifidobacterium longum]
IWREYGAAACLTEKEFDEYAKGADMLYAYRLENPIRYGKPKTLSDIGLKRAPQSWCYLPETGPAGPEPASDHPAEARRLLTAAADQWELHRFTTRDNGMAARDISRMFGGLLARIGEYGKGNTLGKA